MNKIIQKLKDELNYAKGEHDRFLQKVRAYQEEIKVLEETIIRLERKEDKDG